METPSSVNTAKGPLRRAGRCLQKPWVSVTLLVALTAWVEALPVTSGLRSVVLPLSATRCYFTQHTYFLREHNHDGTTTFERIDEGESSWDRISQLQTQRPNDLVSFSIGGGPRKIGFAATTTRTINFRTTWFGKPYPEVDRLSVQEAYARTLERDGNTEDARRIRSGTTRWVEPMGYAINALGAVLLGGLAWSLGWVRDVGEWGRGRRVRRGLCGACSYDLSACVPLVDGTRKCPECGGINPGIGEPKIG